MKTWQKLTVGKFAILFALLFLGVTAKAQTNNGVRPPSDNWVALNPAFANNPAAAAFASNLLAQPQPELSVPQVSQSGSGIAGTFWTLKNAPVPLPYDPYPDLPVYSLGTNGQYLIDDRSVDYAALDQQMQEEAALAGLTNPPVSFNPINTNGLWLEVPPDSLAVTNHFKVILHNTIEGQSYDFLTTDSLSPTISWATELTTNNNAANFIETALAMNGRTNLFVLGRVTQSYSFYINTPPISQDVFDGDSVTFYVNVGGNTNLTFQWTFNGADIAGATNSSYTIDSVQDADAGYYAVIISDGTNSLVTPAAQLTTEASTGDANLIPVTSGRQNYTFKSGVTYYINSQTFLYGKTTIEGGAILKFDENYNSSLVIMDGLTCKTEPYNPAILTTIDDDAVGEYLGFSSSDPQTAANGTPYLDLTYSQSNSISNLRICFADWGVTTPLASRKLDVWDCQFVECNYGIVNLIAGTGAADSLHNVLFAACGAAVGASSNSIAIDGEQVTADVGDFCLANVTPSRIALTNSILWGNSPTASTLSTVNVASNPNGTNFVYEGNGSYYLAVSSPLHKAGTASISSRLQTDLQNKTTYAPISIPAYTQVSSDLTLSPQAARYTNGVPDIGYYYDALDYSVANLTLSGGNVTILPGTAIAVRNDYNAAYDYYTVEGILVQQGSSFISHGTPTKPNIFTSEKMVQEFPETGFAYYQIYNYGWWFSAILFASDFELGDSSAPTFDFRFSKFYLPANDYHLWSGMDESGQFEVSPDSSIYLSLQDCNFHGGRINLGNPDYNYYDPSQVYATGAVSLLNNSFENVSINLDPTYNEYGYGVNCDEQVLAYNNLFKGGLWFHLEPFTASAGNWIFTDNLFDHADLIQDTSEPLDYNYNGYWPLSADELSYDYNFYSWNVGNTNKLQTTTTGDSFTDGGNEVTLTSAPPYQSGTFGRFYLPDTTPLYGAGSRSPADAGLYQYTTRTDQTKEGSETSGHKVNIGVHYVAANIYGQPKDSDSDSIPDYVEDANGNGAVDSNETDPNNPVTDGVTPDASNTAYDALDLDGDGLTGAAERFFGTNPLIQDNPLSLVAVPQQSIMSGIVQIPLSISNSVDTNTTFVLQVNGISQSTLVYQTNGSWFAQCDTTAFANGYSQLSMEYDLDENTPVFGSTKFVNFQNDICFPNTLPICGDSLYVEPQTIYPNGSFTMDVYDDNTNLVTEIDGDIDADGYCDDPNTGNPGISVSLLDTNGNNFGSESYTVSITASGSSQVSNARFHANASGGGSSSTATKKIFYSHPWSGHRWIISYYPAYGSLESGSQAATDLADMMETVAAVVHNTAYGNNDDGVINNINTTAGNPYSFSLDGGNQWNQLRGLITDNRSENFFYFGHGAVDFIGVKSGNKITSADLVGLLTNNIQSGIQAIYGPLHHPYRFVFLDGCNTAKGNLPAAFGIPPIVVSDDDWNNKYRIQPRAFIGWSTYTAASVKNTLPQDHKRFVENFYGDWQSGALLQDALHDATADAESGGQQFTHLDQKVTRFGDPDLPFYQ
jgi:hypothetical protein